MVVKIVREGVHPNATIHHVTCRKCLCQFSFNPPDAQLVPDQRDGDFYRIDCPCCGEPVTKAKS